MMDVLLYAECDQYVSIKEPCAGFAGWHGSGDGLAYVFFFLDPLDVFSGQFIKPRADGETASSVWFGSDGDIAGLGLLNGLSKKRINFPADRSPMKPRPCLCQFIEVFVQRY